MFRCFPDLPPSPSNLALIGKINSVIGGFVSVSANQRRSSSVSSQELIRLRCHGNIKGNQMLTFLLFIGKNVNSFVFPKISKITEDSLYVFVMLHVFTLCVYGNLLCLLMRAHFNRIICVYESIRADFMFSIKFPGHLKVNEGSKQTLC